MGSESDAENLPAKPQSDTDSSEKAPADGDTGSATTEKTAADVPPPSETAPADESAPAEESAATDAGAAPARKKKKKKRKRAESAESAEAPRPRGPAHAADGSERPAFVLDFPEDADLSKLTAAFEAGNYAYVREHGPDVAERSSDPAVRRAATELLARIEPDPLIRFVLGVSVLLLLFLTYYAYSNHGH